jgi:hypothetical protein
VGGGKGGLGGGLTGWEGGVGKRGSGGYYHYCVKSGVTSHTSDTHCH